ncbi:hypothetical protein BDFB_005278 [Asbolus verrucosus]
MFEYT